MAGVRLPSLQVGPSAEQLADAPFPIIDLGSRFDATSFDDLAAVMVNLDAIVSVCTSAAHLAGRARGARHGRPDARTLLVLALGAC